MLVKFKKLHDAAVLPSYAKDGDAAMDCVAVDMIRTPVYIEYKLGLAVEVPKDHVALIFPRSSVTNKDMMLGNAVGVIDSGYRGEITARFKYLDNKDAEHYKIGDRVCQIMIIPYPKIETVWAEELSETERGIGGYGSSGA